MDNLKRRDFLKYSQRALAGVALFPLLHWPKKGTGQIVDPAGKKQTCWLDVCAPFIVEDDAAGIHSEIVLTSDTFSGRNGHEDKADATEYEIYLYRANGEAIGPNGVAKRLTVPAMHTTVIPVRDLLDGQKSFSGGMTVKLRPKGREPMHASDLFSSAFVRWSTNESFDNVHANPDPLQWQKPEPFYYSIPFPPLQDYQCVFGIFNPYAKSSRGSITMYSPTGQKLKEIFYDLKPFTSRFIAVNTGESVQDGAGAFQTLAANEKRSVLTSGSGTIAVTNQEGSLKNFGYLLVKNPQASRFSIDHPIHQSPFNPLPSADPFDAELKFKAKNILYTPLVFRSKKIGGITLDSRFHLSSGAPIEENLWLSPFITDAKGEVPWAAKSEADLPLSISRKQMHRGVLKLGGHQSCVLDCAEIDLPNGFAGGLSLGVRANSNHTLMKVELKVREWGAHAFTHFRPGIFSAREYQKAEQRGGLMTDYIATGARFKRNGGKIILDEIIAVMNIDNKGILGKPTLEVFSSGGLVGRVKLGEIPAFACCHFLFSEILNFEVPTDDLTFRLVDSDATLVMSIIHLDNVRRDIALDHGSDRFSTFNAYNCDPKQA